MGEILARVPSLRGNFAPRFVAWLENEEVFLDQEILDAGTIWAIGRLGPGDAFPEALVGPILVRFLENGGPAARGASAWTAGRLGLASLAPGLERLHADEERSVLLVDGEVVDRTVGELAAESLATFTRGTR
jgi:hypothetical protein